jgi:hypothetical protein
MTPLVALALLVCSPCWPETYRFDMGSESSPVTEGYVRVTHATLLAANPAFGWLQPPRGALFRADPANPYYANQDASPEFALYSDGVLSIEENAFVILVQPGRYVVTAVIGDLALGEGFPRPDMTGVPLNELQAADGSLSTIERVWSNCAPEAVEAFRESWTTAAKDVAGTAAFLLIDEPRGMWYSGSFGDHSAPAQEAFRRWAAERGYADLAERGIPPRGRTLDFYRFYQFRLESVPRFSGARAVVVVL